ncbi:uncharacterized protein K02A2.6-like [Episyrphus balteatus]|uniref:uncharacterized protein K02A2.6-like n=1 Tax=Episyrphus balteatus TaxID=286459 RepID=UPI002485A089|nr:uncharacterized protein K02A2.6-like [Episyrphus balteatus]
MAHVDALSRTPIIAAVSTVELDKNIQVTQERDTIIRSIREKLEKGEVPGYFLENGLVFRVGLQNSHQLYVPKELEDNIMRSIHEKCGHLGIDKCANQLLKNYYIPNVKEKFNKFIKNCIKCIYNSAPHRSNERNLYNIPKRPEPFDSIHIDHFGPLPSNNSRRKYVFVIIDAFTKFVKLYPVNTPGSREAINALERYFDYFSRPRRIISDRGTSFTSQEFSSFVEKHNIDHIKVSVASPQSNGQVERVNRDMKAMLAKLTESPVQNDWRQKLTNVEYALNNTNHTSTKISPSKLLFGVEQRGRVVDELTEYLNDRYSNPERVDLVKLRNDASEAINRSQLYNLNYFKEHHSPPKQFEVGDFVVIKNIDR